MTVLFVAAAVLCVVLVLGLNGEGSMDFYAAAVSGTTRERDRAAAGVTRAKAKAARRRHARPAYGTAPDPHVT
ncbi:hypothetical protein ACWDUM_24285 [Rhodococcus sp. NPDC003322]